MSEPVAPESPVRVKAHPTKAFFVRMLTRDLSLEDCILDLIDNSVDAAWGLVKATPTKLEVGRRLAKYAINLTITDTEFSIGDNCGGISLDDAVEYAFTFGRDDLGGGPEGYTIGVYGIGMKRAVFKLGNEIEVQSTHKNGDSFVVPINVDEWMTDKADSWDFDVEESDQLDEPGVEIRVADLKEETVTTFSDPTFVNALRATIARDYMLSLMQGLTISVNGRTIEGWDIAFKTSRDFQPMRQRYEDVGVSVEIYAGMVTSPPASAEPSERERDHRSGWYVLCNGRVVVAADRSDLTIWGRDGFPSWHGQYSGFVGIVLFSSQQPELLPMTTTKRSIDEASAVYRRALVAMRTPTRSWIDYTNARKTMTEEAREKESKTTPLPITQVKDRKQVKLPTPKATKKDANVLYTVPVDRMRSLAKALGKSTMSYAEVGRRSFDYAYDRMVEDE